MKYKIKDFFCGSSCYGGCGKPKESDLSKTESVLLEIIEYLYEKVENLQNQELKITKD